MLKFLRVAAPLCSLMILHAPSAHAAWQTMYSYSAFPSTATAFSGNGNTSLYVCRVPYEGGIHPGWTTPGRGACSFGWGGQEHDSAPYEIWVEDWQPASNGNVPGNAIVLGYEQPALPFPGLSIAKPRYACQTTDPYGGIASGKVAPDLGGCFYPWGGLEHVGASYNVLVDSAAIDPLPDSKDYPREMLGEFSNPTATYALGLYTSSWPAASSVVSGREATGQTLYLCAASYLDGIHIGKIRPGFGGCFISYGGREIGNLSPFFMLSDNWLRAPGNVDFIGGDFPVGQPVSPGSAIYRSTVIGGNEQSGSNLYLCAGAVSGLYPDPNVHYLPGKLSKALGGCSVALNGREYIAPSYLVLADTFTTMQYIR